MAVSPTLRPFIYFFSLFLYQSTLLFPQITAKKSCCELDDHQLITEFREAKLRVARLESILEESFSKLSSRNLYLRESEKLIKEMTDEVYDMQSVLLNIKNDSSHANERLNGLEEEVRLLWTISRRNNFELHTLESKSQDAEKRLERTASRVQKMAEVVTEQWIQIQQLEQALQITEVRTMQIKSQVSSTRCSFFKFIRTRFGNHFEKSKEMLERTLSATKLYHHQLQGFVKHEMKKSIYTAAFANAEVVFFVASALITFPALTVGMFLYQIFS